MPDHYPDTTNKGISASKFMDGSPVLGKESNVGKLANITRRVTIRVGKVEKVSALNAEKITKLKSITQLRKENVDKKISGSSPGLLTALEGINANVDGMLAVMGDRLRFERKVAGDDRKRAEQAKRGASEKKLESKAFDGLKQTARKVISPAMSLWERLWDFLSTVLLGRVAIKLWKWFSNEENQKKVAAIGRFLKDWWPVLLSSYIIFGTGFIKMTAGLLKAVGWGVTKIVALIPKILAAIGKLKVGRLLKLIPGGGKLGGIKGLTGMFQMGAGAFAGGGQVPGSGDGDTVPAMLTPGEFVMSKGAVQQFGVDTLASMNAAGGGTNRPKLPGLGGGGGGTDSLTEQAKVKTFGSALADFFSGDDGKSRRMTDHDKWMEMAGGGLVQYFAGGGYVDVKGSGDGSTGTLKMFDNAGKQVGKLYDIVSGLSGMGDVSQEDRRNVSGKGYPLPDGNYKLHGFEQHGPLGGNLSGLGDWSSFIGPGSGNIGRRHGLMLHSDIDPYGTLGCIGVGLGGRAGTLQDKEFVKSYMIANPERIKINLGGGSGSKSSRKPSLTADNSSTTTSTSTSTSTSSGSGVSKSKEGKSNNQWWDFLDVVRNKDEKKKGRNQWWDFLDVFRNKEETKVPQYDSSGLNTTWGELGSKARITGDYSVSGLLAKAKENKTPDIKTPVKPTTTIAYDQEMSAQQQAGMTGSGMELPSINAGAMISQAKITTLGISV